MSFKAAKCPNCAGDLQVPEDRDSVKCMYCGSDIIVREAIKAAAASVNIENLLSLAKNAFEAKNFKEAFELYTRVLEVDLNNHEAWLGKGLSAGWMSTLAEFRFQEVINGVEKALEYVPKNLKEEMKWHLSHDISSMVSAYETLADNHRINFAELEEVRVEFILQCRKLLEALEFAHNLAPTNGIVVSEIIFMCTKIIEGSAAMGASEAYYSDVRAKLNLYKSKQQILDPSLSYDEPEIKNSSSTNSQCFVATATMGNANHPIVVLLREFRDSWLLERKHGRMFIKFYYKHGPYLAMIINKYQYLQRISYQMIIRPAACVAGLLLRNER